ncbi:MAG: alkyl sulfatase dimerization domain-containing protein [Actinomycetota bacterium]|nr:alkyl sulfatase dimerization domain-containing protein [Actinomycetota bacterium]
MATEPKPATSHTRQHNAAVMVPSDDADWERARRGLVAQHPSGQIEGPVGHAWDLTRYGFLDSPAAPDTVNPSLWRQAQLNAVHGLFEVAPGVWQARGYDLANVTFIAGANGWIVIDPLTSAACARACLDLANEHLGQRPVTAVLYTHPHVDHFGGVAGVTSEEDVRAGRCRVIAPEGFLAEAVSENLLAGPAMSRRVMYQVGLFLPPGPHGQVDAGLGKAVPFDRAGLIAPTEDVTHTGQELVVDGVRIVFQLTPGSEAPVEMNFLFPDHGWLCMAENCTHTMHNLVPIRGALVRDALGWSKYIGEAIELFADRAELCFASHHWPRWGREDVAHFLRLQRDLYRFLHDQALRLANEGLTPHEIAARVELSPELAAESHTRCYYGDVRHNVRAVYQRYLSWYDANPAHLDPQPPVESATRYVELMGGADRVVEQARASFDAGDYRWVVEVVNHVVFADPAHAAARELQADALEQLGYQQESAIFRNAYLTGAHELRTGSPPPLGARNALASALTIEQVFDAMAIRVDPDAAAGVDLTLNATISDAGPTDGQGAAGGATERWTFGISNRTLWAVAGRHSEAAAATITTGRATLIALYLGDTSVEQATAHGTLHTDGDQHSVAALYGLLVAPTPGFAIVEP